MKTITLEVFEDHNGNVGLGQTGMIRNETTDAGDGLLIAHDIIEHVNGVSHIGTIDDELEALGAIWYVRGQHGEISRNGAGSYYTIAENIASDIARMFRDYINGADVSFNVPRTRTVLHESELQETLTAADNSYLSEFCEPVEKVRARIQWSRYRAVCLARMRVGYSKARRRWERRGRCAANTQFWAIMDAIEKGCRDMSEGMQYTLRYGNGEATCTVIDEEEFY